MDLSEINKELSEIEALDLNSESKYYFLFSDSISILQTIVFRNENSDFRVSESITIFIDSIDMLIQENLDIKNYNIEIEKLIENHYLFSEVFQYIMDAKGLIDQGKEKIVQSKLNENAIPIDSICNTCNNKPHGLPYKRINSRGEIIDTINPNN